MSRPADRHAKIELLRAAESVFAEHGLASAKVEDITARAGKSKGAFYLHFESKDDCWRQIIEAFLTRLAACVEPPPIDETAAPPKGADHMAQALAHNLQIFEFCWQNRALLRMILEGGGGAPYGYLVDEFGERATRNSEAWIRHGKATGVYRAEIDEHIAARMISGAYERLIRELIKQPKRPDIQALCLQALDINTRGLLSDKARGEAIVLPGKNATTQGEVADHEVTDTHARRATRTKQAG
jgi:AcrR family transcriptional regulator